MDLKENIKKKSLFTNLYRLHLISIQPSIGNPLPPKLRFSGSTGASSSCHRVRQVMSSLQGHISIKKKIQTHPQLRVSYSHRLHFWTRGTQTKTGRTFKLHRKTRKAQNVTDNLLALRQQYESPGHHVTPLTQKYTQRLNKTT